MVTDVLHSENRSQLGGQEFDSRKDTRNPNCDKSKEADAPPRNQEQGMGSVDARLTFPALARYRETLLA